MYLRYFNNDYISWTRVKIINYKSLVSIVISYANHSTFVHSNEKCDLQLFNRNGTNEFTSFVTKCNLNLKLFFKLNLKNS